MMIGHSISSHSRIRVGQKSNYDIYHHPEQKISHLQRLGFLREFGGKADILEVFAGEGNLTKFYELHGNVTPLKREFHGSSFDYIYKIRSDNIKYDVIDIDSYGYPDLFFPVVFEIMKKDSYLIFTFPVVGVNCLNNITEQHYINFWHSERPTIGDITGVLTDMALRNWIIISLVDISKIKRIWRFVFKCRRVLATEMCNVRNKPDNSFGLSDFGG